MRRLMINVIKIAAALTLATLTALPVTVDGAARAAAGTIYGSVAITDIPELAEIPAKKIAYLTIDDGPSRAITPKILDLLAAEGIKATFFVLPHNNLDDLYRRIIDEGHEIGNHTYSHVYSKLYDQRDLEGFVQDVREARKYIFEKIGYLTVSFRFPGGPMGRAASIIDPRREALSELGYSDFAWHVDAGDARAGNTDKSTNALVANVLQNTRDRAQLIVLMHDTSGKKTTLEALPRIINGLRERGYTFDVLRNYDDPNGWTSFETEPADIREPLLLAQ